MESGRGRTTSTERGYWRYAALYLGDWLLRPLDAITRREVESRFRHLTERHGEMPANQCLSFLRSVYRRPCVDHEGLRNPVEQWLSGGGGTTAKGGSGYRLRPRCCHAGTEESRRR